MRRTDVRALAKGVLGQSGLEIRLRRERGSLRLEARHPRLPGRVPGGPPAPPRLFDHPVDALYHLYGGKAASFDCPLEDCVDVNGLNFRDGGWHPFTATLLEYARGEISGYEGSALQRYYERWRPTNLLEAFMELPHSDGSSLHELPSHMTYFYPWSAKSAAEADETIRNNFYQDHVEHGRPDLTIEEHGCKGHGPVSDEAGRFEFERLVGIYRSLAEHGYQREYGDVRVLVVRREEQTRFIVCGGGLHRTAAMKALGYETLPATFNNVPTIFDVAEAHRWLQVREGPWSRITAERYIDHLFDFDAFAWATRMGIAFADGGRPIDQAVGEHARPSFAATANAKARPASSPGAA